MNETWNRRAFWLGATALGLVLFGCGDGPGIGKVLNGDADDIVCVCPGSFSRLGNPCPTPPEDGTIAIGARCAPEDANLPTTGFCRATVQTSNPQVLDLMPSTINVFADNEEHLSRLGTKGAIVPNANQEVEIFSDYEFPSGEIERVFFGRVLVSETCSP
jgi:hypothetical protein